MSAEVRESVYLKCDNVSFAGFGCQSTFGYNDRTPADANGLQAIAAMARGKGWQVEVYGQGLKGFAADAFCPMHRRPTSTTPLDEPEPTDRPGEFRS